MVGHSLSREGLAPPILCQLSWRTPSWVNHVVSYARLRLPLHPRYRTSLGVAANSRNGPGTDIADCRRRRSIAVVAPRCRPVGSMVVALADVDPLPAVCGWPPLVAINVAVVVEAEAAVRPAETVPREVVSSMSAVADIASTATAISEMEASVATGGPRTTACADAKARTAAAHPRPGTTPAAALQCSCATTTGAHSAAASGHPAATAAATPAASGHPAATVAAASATSGAAATTTVTAATTTTTTTTTTTARPAATTTTTRPAK